MLKVSELQAIQAFLACLLLLTTTAMAAPRPNAPLIAVDDLRLGLGAISPGSLGVTGNHSRFRNNLPNTVALPRHFKNNGHHAAVLDGFDHGVAPESTQTLTTQLVQVAPSSIAASDVPPRVVHGSGFETQKPGAFESLESELGTWTTTAGKAQINAAMAASGKQCLHLMGGQKTIVELNLADEIDTTGQLTFRAERWTQRAPFSFRIEKKSGSQWLEIYNGDKEVVVGRSFKSKIAVRLDDANIQSLRFSVTSPANTGIMIDDLRIAPAVPQEIVSVEVVPVALPALVGASASALVKLKVETTGMLNPISVTALSARLDAGTDIDDIESMQVYYGGSNSGFQTGTEFGQAKEPASQLSFEGNQVLAEGANYVWVACTLSATANIDHRIGATCSEISFSNGKTYAVGGPASIQQLGVSVRAGGDDGVHTYRIPGLATTTKGTLIAVYDVRHRGGGDLPGDIDVGLSRSTDGGRTWEPMQVIMDMGSDPDFRYDGIGDPTVVVDTNSGTIWCAATWSHGNRSWVGSGPGLDPEETGQLMLVKSEDDGVTWSQPINITKQVKQPEWSFLLQGPGKGITMQDGTIVIPAQYQDPPNERDERAHRLPHSAFIYSRDHGETWDISTGAYDDTTEAQVIELADGQIMINCRYNREDKRVVMTTNDKGKTWQEHPTSRKSLVEPRACMASLINVGRELRVLGVRGEIADRDDFLLFSNPDSTRGRNHITIKASTDGGLSWPSEHHLLLDEQNGRGYSCLTMIDAETVGILYEGSQADMTFQRVKLTDILNPPQGQKTKNPAQRSDQTVAIIETIPEFAFSRVFGDHMVLQAQQPIRVWGRAHAGADGVFHPATAAISGAEVRVSSPKVSDPKHARYAWSDFPNPKPNLVNSSGIPASPFTSEDSVPDGEPATADNRPNILFIVSEDNGEHLGCYGEDRVHTPHLDALATGGVRYTRAYVPYSVCSPSRAVFLTGLYTRQTGHIGLATHRFSLVRDFKTMPAYFQQAGYYTGFLGKTHINPEHVVEEHVDHRAIRDANFGKTISIETYAEEAGTVINKAADREKPFLLIINYADAHRKFVRKSKNGFPTRQVEGEIEPFPWIGSDSAHLREELRDYFNCMNRLDEGVGMVLEKLDEAAVRDNTLVVYISDHGADFPRGKGSVYENGIRIPMIVNYPKSFPQGKVEDAMVSTIDILPTMLQAAGMPVPVNLPGLSLQDIDSGKSLPRKYIHTFTTGSSPNLLYVQFGIRDERYKLVYNPDRALNLLGASRYTNSRLPESQHVPSFLYPPEYELFDLQEDPYEWKNLADSEQHRDVRQRLLEAMQDFQHEIKDPFASKKNLATFIAEQKEYVHKPYKRAGFRWPHLSMFEQAQGSGDH